MRFQAVSLAFAFLLVPLCMSCGDDDDGGGSGSGAVVCGDGVLATTEECEGFALRGATCGDLGYSGGSLRCSDSCTFDESGCSECGNGIAEDDEICDGDDLRGNTCATVFGSGAQGELECTADCSALSDGLCSEPAPAPELSACETDGDCASSLECVSTDVGDYCLEPCSDATGCGVDEFCRVFDTGEGACAPLPTEGERCDEAIGCAGGTDCLGAFNEASVCGETCIPGSRITCGGDTTCVTPPSEPFEVQNGGTCSEAGGNCDSGNGYECVNVGSDRVDFQCARFLGLCSEPRELYTFDGNGPQEAHICDLAEPTAGGRFCSAGGDAFALCYPVFGDAASLGACLALCDDGADGSNDLSCGDGMRCDVPDDVQLYHLDPASTPCRDGNPAGCPGGMDRCLDFGDGAICARASRICVFGDPVPQ